MDGDTALISRSGLDLSRFHIRYSHAAVARRDETGTWSARQLYYACDEARPRIYDQGLAGFVMGTDDPALGYISIVRLPAGAAQSLRYASLDTSRVQHLLATSYSANAYPFSTRYQNCNQWVVEMLAVAWVIWATATICAGARNIGFKKKTTRPNRWTSARTR
jgi:hypothetical protein